VQLLITQPLRAATRPRTYQFFSQGPDAIAGGQAQRVSKVCERARPKILGQCFVGCFADLADSLQARPSAATSVSRASYFTLKVVGIGASDATNTFAGE
jgi:hypothetical protein